MQGLQNVLLYKTVQPVSGGGADRSGVTGPNRETDGVPTAAEICMAAESLHTHSNALFITAADISNSSEIMK